VAANDQQDDALNDESEIKNIALLESLGSDLAAKRQKSIDARVASGIDAICFVDVYA
jgi:hypothetical protein